MKKVKKDWNADHADEADKSRFKTQDRNPVIIFLEGCPNYIPLQDNSPSVNISLISIIRVLLFF